MARQVGAVEEESAGLVSQDSYDDDLPYVPTTLPEGLYLIAIIHSISFFHIENIMRFRFKQNGQWAFQ